jgi:ubiquitin carboxyl-terminal hydrolase 8
MTTTYSKEDIERIRKEVTTSGGLCGLENIGNTCYMNSALQCLFATNIFTAYFLDKEFVKQLEYNIEQEIATSERKKQKLEDDTDVEINQRDVNRKIKNTVVYAYYRLIKTVWADNQTIKPEEFKTVIGNHNSIFKGYMQNDSQELLDCVLDSIHEELKSSVKVNYDNISDEIVSFRKTVKQYQKMLKESSKNKKLKLLENYREYLDQHMAEYTINSSLEYWEKYIQNSHSVIRNIFTGMTYSSTKCNECKFTSLAFAPFLTLPLPIPESHQSVKLIDCLKQFSETAKLTGEHKYKCDVCADYKDAEQTTYFWEYPEIFMIQLKRFSNKRRGNYEFTEKNSTMIEYPLKDLDISMIKSSYCQDSPKYELYGVVLQSGSLSGGHYTAVCKNPVNDKWYKFDDSRVLAIKETNIESVVNSSSAYILFYKKQYEAIDSDE